MQLFGKKIDFLRFTFPLLFMVLFFVLFQNCSSGFKINDELSLHGTGVLNAPGQDPLSPSGQNNSESFPPDWGGSPALAENSDGKAPQVQNRSFTMTIGKKLEIDYLDLADSAVKFEIKPIGSVQGRFYEDLSEGQPILVYSSPLNAAGADRYEFVAVDADGDKSQKAIIEINLAPHPIEMKFDNQLVLDESSLFRMGVALVGPTYLRRKLEITNRSDQSFNLGGIYCFKEALILGLDPADHPNGYPKIIRAGETIRTYVNYYGQAPEGELTALCKIETFGANNADLSRSVNVSLLIAGTNVTPNFQKMDLKINAVSLKDPATGATAGNMDDLDRILRVLNRDFTIGGNSPFNFIKGSYRILESSNYVIKTETWMRELQTHVSPGEVTYFIGAAFNTDILGHAPLGGQLHMGVPIAIRADTLESLSVVASHELGHVVNLDHTAQIGAAKNHSLSTGIRSFCKLTDQESSYIVHNASTQVPLGAELNIMYYQALKPTTGSRSFATEGYQLQMLKFMDCWKAVSRLSN